VSKINGFPGGESGTKVHRIADLNRFESIRPGESHFPDNPSQAATHVRQALLSGVELDFGGPAIRHDHEINSHLRPNAGLAAVFKGQTGPELLPAPVDNLPDPALAQ
jgi:hypothetical protein